MNFIDYIKDKVISLFIFLITFLLTAFLLFFLKAHPLLQISISIILILAYFAINIYDFYRRKNFYDYFNKMLLEIDKKTLITEIISKSNFIDGNIFLEYIYDINKYYNEELNHYKYSFNEFKDYIELWCHEIKNPIATSKLLLENSKIKEKESFNEELIKIDNYIEQVLYYARSEVVEKDCIINKTNLKLIINTVIRKNKKILIMKRIKVDTFDNDIYIESDSKWLEFIVNQIVTNSIKYSRKSNAFIEFKCEVNKNNTTLFIKDNGIGINEEDISKVFDKGFTGTNGRSKYNSTGIGLYLCRKLCNKLNHTISISSRINEYTTINITFPNSSLINEIK